MVRSKKLSLIFLCSILIATFNLFLDTKFFLAGIIGIVGILALFYDLRIGIFMSALLYPFMPDIIGLLMFLAMGIFYVLRKIILDKGDLNITHIGLGIGLFFVVMTITTITSVDIKGSLRDFGLNLAGISFLFAFVNTIKNKEELNGFISVFLLSALIVSLLGIYQKFTGVQMRPEWLDVDNNPDIAARVYSVFLNPNILAEYLVFLTPIAVGITWYTKDLKKKILFSIATICLLGCLMLTLSRGGWLGIFAAAFIFVMLIDKRLLLLAIPIIILAIMFLPEKVIERLGSIGSTLDSSNMYRIKIWQITLELIKDHSIGGVGFGHIPYKETFETYIRTMPIFHAHNSYLQMAAETGIPGLFIFLMMILSNIKEGYVNLVKSDDKYYKYVGAGCIASIVGILTHGMFEHFLYIPRIIFTFWIVMALIITMVKLKKESTKVI